MMLKNKVVLVTGGAGFIGSHLVDKCLAEGAEKVVALDNFAAGNRINLAHLKDEPRFELKDGDVQDFEVVKPLVEGSDVILHEAASKLVASLKNPRVDLGTNIIGTFNILEAARNADPQIIHASTGSVLGSSDEDMLEDAPTNPTTLYGISKLAGEKYCTFYAKEFGVNASVLRYFHVFGPRQDYSGEAGVINIFLSKVLQGKPPVIYSGGTQIRCFTYISDDVDANFLLLQNKGKVKGEIYNVASRTRMSVNELADTIIKKYATKPLEPEQGETRQGENYRPVPDTKKVEKLGFKEKVSFEDGLEKTKQWIEKDLRAKGVLK